jgi:hypothetical protein
MSLVTLAAVPLASGVNTTMSEGGLIVLSIGAMVCLAALLIPVNLAARTPHRPGPAPLPPRHAAVTGGAHPGDARSVAAHRAKPAVPSDQGQAAQAPATREGEGTAGQG